MFQEEMDFSPELYKKLVDALPIPIYCRKADGTIKMCNQAFARILGKSREEIIGKEVKDLLPPEKAEVLQRKDKEILDGGIDQIYEGSMVFADGNKRDLIVNKAAMRLDGESITGIVASIIDITERRKALEQLQRAEEEKKVAATLLQKIRAGIVIVDENLKIIESNLGFARMFGEENEELFETIPGLKGAELDMIAPDMICSMFKSILESGESRLERDLKMQTKLLSISVMTIQKHKVAGAIIRDMSAPMLERAEIIERARQVNRKNMKTVQQIAYLLGENAAQTEELLNSIIQSQSYNDMEE
jgi:PAS domain S-box-containing protein